MLLLFSLAALIARALKPSASWPILLISYVVLGVCWYGNHSILNFNLHSEPVHSELMGPISPAIRNSDGRSVLQSHL